MGNQDAFDSANEFLQTISINEQTTLDQSLLITILGLQIHSAHRLNELQRKVSTMAVDVSKLQEAASAAVALLEQLAANNTDPATQAAIDAVTDQLNNAVSTNTPVDTPPAV